MGGFVQLGYGLSEYRSSNFSKGYDIFSRQRLIGRARIVSLGRLSGDNVNAKGINSIQENRGKDRKWNNAPLEM